MLFETSAGLDPNLWKAAGFFPQILVEQMQKYFLLISLMSKVSQTPEMHQSTKKISL